MRYFLYIIGIFLAILSVFYIVSEFQARNIRHLNQPIGKIADLPSGKLHYADLTRASLTYTPVLFIHGASSNLNDHHRLLGLGKLGPAVADGARSIFVDRPGHGYSELKGARTPALQAKRYVELLDYLEVEQVVLVSHSMGSLSAITMALNYPSRVKSMVMLAPIGYPDQIDVSWYFRLASTPIIGPIFAKTIVIPFKRVFLKHGMEDVFFPQIISRFFAGYSNLEYELQSDIFLQSSQEVVALREETRKLSRSYDEIRQNVVIITGDEDIIVDYSTQAVRLAENIPGAKLIILPGVGHKPEYANATMIVQEIYKLAK